MYGLINNALQSMIRDKFGDEQWESVLEATGVPNDSFLTMRQCDDAITYSLAGAAAKVLGAPVETCLEMFGEYWVLETASKSYGPLMDASGGSMVEFLGNMNALHDRITGTFVDYMPPEFAVEDIGDDRYKVHYSSKRLGLIPFVVGLLKGLAQRYNSTLEIHEISELEVKIGTHAVFELSVRAIEA